MRKKKNLRITLGDMIMGTKKSSRFGVNKESIRQLVHIENQVPAEYSMGSLKHKADTKRKISSFLLFNTPTTAT
jgi:hypothetical protein